MRRPNYEEPLAQLFQGDALDVLPEMPERSVDCCTTSPPYWGLRLYSGEQERVWNGTEECEHEWGEPQPPHHPGQVEQTMWQNAEAAGKGQNAPSGQFCQRCGAWHGAFGNEPSVALFIAHLMEFMAAIKRVLKDTGVAWINLGDSFVTSPAGNKTPSGFSQIGRPMETINPPKGRGSELPALNLAGVPQRFFLACQEQGWVVRSEIILAKDSPMPESIRGWRWQRCQIKVKSQEKGTSPQRVGAVEGMGQQPQRNAPGGEWQGGAQWADCPGCPRCIPNGGLVLRKGSWRPTSSHEKLFMLTKGEGYYSCGEDVRMPQKRDWSNENTGSIGYTDWIEKAQGGKRNSAPAVYNPAGANLRDVLPMKSSNMTMQLCRSCKRVYTGAQFGRLPKPPDFICLGCGGRLTLSGEWNWDCQDCGASYHANYINELLDQKVCSCGASDWLSHFAAFHPSLPTTCILASTSPRGNCSKCGLPWVRVIATVQHEPNEDYDGQSQKDYALAGAQNPSDTKRRILLAQARESQTLDWKPSCSCGAPSEPAVVLDPFNGTASTGIAAKRLGRRYIGIDTSEDYLLLSAARLAAETAGLI